MGNDMFREATIKWIAFFVMLSFSLCAWPAGLMAQSLRVGIDYVSSGSEPLGFLEDPDGNPAVYIVPYPLSSPDSHLVTDGGFDGFSEQSLQAEVFRKIQEKFYSIPVQEGRELNIDFVLGRVEGEGSVNAILGETESEVLTWFGYTTQVGSGLETPDGEIPNGQNATAVSIENISDILGGELGVSYGTYESAVNVVANITAHEIGHVYGLYHVSVEPLIEDGDPLPSRYPLMATIPEGMPAEGWILDNAFTSESGAQPTGRSSVEDLVLNIGLRRVADFDLDGDVDTNDVNTAVSNFTGASPTLTNPKHTLGDADHDGDIDTVDVGLAVQYFGGAKASAFDVSQNDAIANLIIDKTDGSVILDADGAVLGGFTIFSDSGNFVTENTDFSDLPSGLTDNIAEQIGWSQPFSEFTGVADLGNILPAGLAEADYLDDVTGVFANSLSAGGGGDLQVSVIPEPATMSLLAVGGLGALIRRKRR